MNSTDSTHSQKSEYDDDESEDSRSTTPAEDYHFIPISSSGNLSFVHAFAFYIYLLTLI